MRAVIRVMSVADLLVTLLPHTIGYLKMTINRYITAYRVPVVHSQSAPLRNSYDFVHL